MLNQKLSRDFYLQDTFEVTKKLLGAYLCTCIDGKVTAGKIVEAEAYIGGVDKASHSYKDKRTKRTEIQFGIGGYAYIFLIYGVYAQFCVVTGAENISDVVLIRALEPIEGIELMQERRKTEKKKEIANGPGRLCTALGITTSLYGEDLCGEKIWIASPNEPILDSQISCAKRIGIDYAEEFAEKPWRFYITDSDCISKKDKNAVPFNMLDTASLKLERGVHRIENIRPTQIPVSKEAISLTSWNINGIRSASQELLSWITETSPYIIALQEIKAQDYQIPLEISSLSDYFSVWNSGQVKGYSGTALLSREKPISVEKGLGIPKFDEEGRTIIAEYNQFFFINCYFPNGGRDHSRIPFKLEFYQAFFDKCEELRKQKPVIFCGDVNTSHKEIDLSHPKANSKKTGFLPEERAWVDKFIQAGYVDTFRFFYPNSVDQFTWWSTMSKSREKNVGWRLDYFFVSSEIIDKVKDAYILSGVLGSDHCPIGINCTWNNIGKPHIAEIKPVIQQMSLLG